MSSLRLVMLGQLSNLTLEDRSARILLHDREGFESAIRTLDAMGGSRGMNSHRLAWAVAFNINGVPASSTSQPRAGRSGRSYQDHWPANVVWPTVWSELVRTLAPDDSGHVRTLLSELALSVACEQREEWQSPPARPIDRDVANKAFEFVYAQNRRKVLGMCRQFANVVRAPEAIADEAWSRVFSDFWSAQARRRFLGLSRISTLVCKVARYIYLDSIRESSRFVTNRDEMNEDGCPMIREIPGTLSDPEEFMIEDELQSRMQECIKRLTARQRIVAEMLWLRHINSKRVAQILGVTEPAISQHLKKARDSLRICLGEHGFQVPQ